MAKKKVNPRRVPLPKKAIDKDAIIEEAMKDDMAHSWLLVIEGQLVFQESAEEEKQQQMAMAVGLKEFSSQFKGVQNENDLQIGGVEQIDCKSIFGISDYDALSLAKHEEIVLITAEPAIEAIACIPNSGVLSVGIADFLALSKIPAVKMLSCIEKMIDFRFLFPITEKVVLSLIDCYNQSESEDKKTELIQRWAKVLEKPLDDQAYARPRKSLCNRHLMTV